MFVLYNLILTLLAPIWVPWMLWRAYQRKEAPNWTERQGDYEIVRSKDRKRVWIHAVSVGEVIAAIPILKELRSKAPDLEIVLTTTTSSGHQTAREGAQNLYDHLFYFPIDIARFQLAAMQRVQPQVVAIMETELWMNFLWAAKTFEAKTLLINGRISDRSFKRSQAFKFFFSALLKQMDRCLMQTPADADRIRALGAEQAEAVGNTKFDQALQGQDETDWRAELKLPAGKPIVVVGSTRGEAEEKFVVSALKTLGFDHCAIVHAPRHLERADEVAQAYEREGLKVGRRSKATGGDVVVLDTYGELDKVYSAADVVIIGGGFSPLGGQNLIQAMAQGKPILHGPHMNNFKDAARTALEAGASQVCATPEELAEKLRALLGNAEERHSRGEAGRQLVLASAGAAARYADAIIAAVNAG